MSGLGRTWSRSAGSLDLDYADATTSAHDLLQQFKTHPMVREDPRGRRAGQLGRQGDPRHRLLGDPENCPHRGAVIVGDAAGMMNLAALKGVHYAIKSGILAAEAIYAGLKAGGNDSPPMRGRLRTRSLARSSTSSATRASPSRRA